MVNCQQQLLIFEKKRLELMLNTDRIASYEEYEKETELY